MALSRIETGAVIAIFMTLLGAAIAVAADTSNGKSAAFATCSKRAHGATFPLLHCYSVEMQAVDGAMATAYKIAVAGVGDHKTRGYLARSQKTWSDFRDAWCEATVPRSGSLARFKLFECRLAETKRRTAALKATTSKGE